MKPFKTPLQHAEIELQALKAELDIDPRLPHVVEQKLWHYGHMELGKTETQWHATIFFDQHECEVGTANTFPAALKSLKEKLQRVYHRNAHQA